MKNILKIMLMMITIFTIAGSAVYAAEIPVSDQDQLITSRDWTEISNLQDEMKKEEPISVRYGIGIEEHDTEGRVITAEFPEYFVVTVYTPNSQDELKRLAYRMEWEDAFLSYLKGLEQEKPVIFCGDLNVAATEMDKIGRAHV